jgi:aminoglycoside phosphotransferase (APT) family kinase protein
MMNLEIVGEGATTKIYRDANMAIKLYENVSPEEAENEAKIQAYVAKTGLPVPGVFGVRRINETMTALDMEYIPGKPLFHEEMDQDQLLDAIQTLVKLQCMVHSKTADMLPKQRERLAWKIDRNKYLEQCIKDDLLTLLHSLDNGANCLCHGDFHPLNILYDGNKYWIIDWVDATSGNPLADACRTYLLLKEGLPPYAGTYLRLFCKEVGIEQDAVLAWQPVLAAARLAENMDEKQKAQLLQIINDWKQ